ncbi:hypothetical protein WICPIJ_008110, partial [Wickerhamomyces pijperi]
MRLTDRFKIHEFINRNQKTPLISVTDSHYYRREDGTRTNQLLVWETNNFNRPRSGSLSQPTLPNPSSSPQASHLQGFPWYELLNGALLRFFNDLPPESYWKTWLSPAEFQYKSTPVKDMWVFLTKVLPSFRLQGDLLALSNWFEDRELVWLESWFQVVSIPHFHTGGGAPTLSFFNLPSSEIDLRFIHSANRVAKFIPALKDHTQSEASLESFKHFYK